MSNLDDISNVELIFHISRAETRINTHIPMFVRNNFTAIASKMIPNTFRNMLIPAVPRKRSSLYKFLKTT